MTDQHLKKISRITNHQGNANQDHHEISPHPIENCHQKAANANKDVETGGFSLTHCW
jgi:hypothetical protein